jgi:hypothetical protein
LQSFRNMVIYGTYAKYIYGWMGLRCKPTCTWGGAYHVAQFLTLQLRLLLGGSSNW